MEGESIMIAGVDIGLRRIGVALSPDGKIILPQKAIERRGRRQASRDLREFLKEWEVDTLVVGLPKGGSSEEEMERRIKHFVSLLDLPANFPIFYQDEAGSSFEAKEQMRGVIRQKRDGRIDSIAAKIILERWIANKE